MPRQPIHLASLPCQQNFASERLVPTSASKIIARLQHVHILAIRRSFKPMYNKTKLAHLKTMQDLAPEAMKAFWAFDKAATADGAIPVKYKELIAVAVALTTQCPYCIDVHSANARKAGATDAEITEAAIVAASLRAGGAITHATHALSS